MAREKKEPNEFNTQNHFKSVDKYSIPTMQLILEKTAGELPSSVMLGILNISKLIDSKDERFKEITSRYTYSTKNGPYLRSALYQIGDGIFLDIYDGDINEEFLSQLPHGEVEDAINRIESSSEGDKTKFNDGYGNVYFLNGKKEDAIKICKEIIEKYCAEKVESKSTMYVICTSQGGMYLEDFEITDKGTMDLALNYGDEFVKVHETILERLNKKMDKGIVLLHGEPGTGKSSYLRHLVNTVSKEKKIIYIPPDMAHEIASPNFLPFLMNQKNSILFIEDAENILQKRGSGQNQAISNLLNVSDGLLSDCLNIQIICTFNAKIGEVDPALLRKGRLIAKHEFKALSKEEAQRLSDSLGHKTIIQQDSTLAEIYNQDEADFNKPSKKIGFGS